MQGFEDGQRELLDVQSLAGHLLAPGTVFAFLAEHRGELFPDGLFEDLFPTRRGRPSLPAQVAASVMVLQTLQGLSDRETAEALTFDLRWKAACGYAVTARAFHPTTLTYWRNRLAASTRPHRIFEAVATVVAETGVLAGKNRRALDSTVLDDAVARQDTVTQLIAAIRKVGREVPGAGDLVASVCTGYDYTMAGKTRIAWDDPQAKDELITVLVNDALALLAAIHTQALDEDLGEKAAQAVALLALIAGQDVEPAEGSDGTDGRWRIARKVAYDRVISTVDPDARHAHKTQARRQDGFKAHVVVEPDTGIFTATELTKASGPGNGDAAVGIGLLGRDATIPTAPTTDTGTAAGTGTEDGTKVEVLADSAYGSGDMLAAIRESGHTALIKPWPIKPAVPYGFTLDDFTVDESAGTVTCPNNITRTITAKRNVTFGVACRQCPLQDQCNRSASGKSLTLHEHDALQRAHRIRAKDPGFQETYRMKRPQVERSIAWLTRGNRRVPYRGVTKNHAWLMLRAAALNMRRIINLGYTKSGGTWAMA